MRMQVGLQHNIPDMSSLNVRLSQFADDMGIWAHATNAK